MKKHLGEITRVWNPGWCWALQVFKDRPFPFPVSFQLPNSPPKARLEVRGLECVSLG